MLTEKMIENRIRKLLDMAAQIEEIEKAMDDVKNELKNDLTERQTDEVETANGYKVRYKEVTSNRFDSAKLKADFPDVYREYTKEQKSMRFTYSA